MKHLGILCGGSGSSKFASSFSQYSIADGKYDIAFIANVGDNYWHHGLYVCPDIDIIMHALSGQLDVTKGWGIDSDSFESVNVFTMLSAQDEWFRLGSIDSAYCQRRTELMRLGWRLSSITRLFCQRVGNRWPVIPATDDEVTTFVRTKAGLMHLQQYWVKYKAIPNPIEVIWHGQISAKANPDALEYLNDRVIICPANPVTSISPTTGLAEIKRKLKSCRVVAISPFVGGQVISGPAGKLMGAMGIPPSSLGVARMYSSFLKLLILDSHEDTKVENAIADLGIECYKTNIRIDISNSQSFANEIMNIL